MGVPCMAMPWVGFAFDGHALAVSASSADRAIKKGRVIQTEAFLAKRLVSPKASPRNWSNCIECGPYHIWMRLPPAAAERHGYKGVVALIPRL